jgi:hypothetical protein
VKMSAGTHTWTGAEVKIGRALALMVFLGIEMSPHAHDLIRWK